MNRKRVCACLLLTLIFVSIVCAQNNDDAIESGSLTPEVLSSVFNSAYIGAKVDGSTVILNDNNSVYLIELNTEEKTISFYIFWNISDGPMSKQRVNVLNSLIQKWHSEKLYARFFVGNDKTIVGDYTFAYEDTVSKKHIINSFRQFQKSANFFSFTNYQAIKDSYLLDLVNSEESNEYSTFSFIQYVLNPTMDGENKTVSLENEDYLIIHEPDMHYSMLDKKTGKTIYGMHGFITKANDFSSAKVYYMDLKGKIISREQFLKESNYENNAEIVFTPVNCTERQVTYKYIKPDSMKDKTLTLSIKIVSQ
jgi:hypothetical protein